MVKGTFIHTRVNARDYICPGDKDNVYMPIASRNNSLLVTEKVQKPYEELDRFAMVYYVCPRILVVIKPFPI